VCKGFMAKMGKSDTRTVEEQTEKLALSRWAVRHSTGVSPCSVDHLSLPSRHSILTGFRAIRPSMLQQEARYWSTASRSAS
jgi:hypothetical protein